MKPDNLFYQANELSGQILDSRARGIHRGIYCGYEKLDEHYTMLPGSTTYVYGPPFSGKSLYWFQICVNIAKIHGHTTAVWSPETGRAKDIMIKFLTMWMRKSVYKQGPPSYIASEEEIYNAMAQMNGYFFTPPDDRTFKDVTEFYEWVDSVEQTTGIKINQTVIDPWNELEGDLAGDPRDIYTSKQLKKVRINAVKNNRHNTILTHPTKIIPVKGKFEVGDGQQVERNYIPPVRPDEVLNGQEFHRKGMMMLSIWRPPEGLINDATGEVFNPHTTRVIVQKYKPEFTGKLGFVDFILDKEKHTYLEVNGHNDFKAPSAQKTTPKLF